MSNPFEGLKAGLVSRRAALAGGAALLAGAAVSAAAAQEATPRANENPQDPTFLFVQLADAGTWTVSPENPEEFLLTLFGVPRESIFFSDRPERIVGTVPTARLLDGLGFTPVNPPNAAIVVRTPEGERDVLVVELYAPVYSEAFGSGDSTVLTYRAQLLDAYRGDGLVSWYDEQEDPELPTEFTDVSLFIDDCPDLSSCWAPTSRGRIVAGPIPSGSVGQCWDWNLFDCRICDESRSMALRDECNAAYPDQCGGDCWPWCYSGACGGGFPIL